MQIRFACLGKSRETKTSPEGTSPRLSCLLFIICVPRTGTGSPQGAWETHLESVTDICCGSETFFDGVTDIWAKVTVDGDVAAFAGARFLTRNDYEQLETQHGKGKIFHGFGADAESALPDLRSVAEPGGERLCEVHP